MSDEKWKTVKEREKDAKDIKYVSLIERRKEEDRKRKGERKNKTNKHRKEKEFLLKWILNLDTEKETN